MSADAIAVAIATVIAIEKQLVSLKLAYHFFMIVIVFVLGAR